MNARKTIPGNENGFEFSFSARDEAMTALWLTCPGPVKYGMECPQMFVRPRHPTDGCNARAV